MQDLSVGQIVTVSPNLRTGDRSFSQELWEVMALNDLHVCLKWAGGETFWMTIGGGRPVYLLRAEHTFADASAFLAHEVPL